MKVSKNKRNRPRKFFVEGKGGKVQASKNAGVIYPFAFFLPRHHVRAGLDALESFTLLFSITDFFSRKRKTGMDKFMPLCNRTELIYRFSESIFFLYLMLASVLFQKKSKSLY